MSISSLYANQADRPQDAPEECAGTVSLQNIQDEFFGIPMYASYFEVKNKMSDRGYYDLICLSALLPLNKITDRKSSDGVAGRALARSIVFVLVHILEEGFVGRVFRHPLLKQFHSLDRSHVGEEFPRNPDTVCKFRIVEQIIAPRT